MFYLVFSDPVSLRQDIGLMAVEDALGEPMTDVVSRVTFSIEYVLYSSRSK